MVINCMSKFYKSIDRIDFLLEKKRKRKTTSTKIIKNKSESNRVERAKDVKITGYKVKTNENKIIHNGNARSSEQTESKRHKCQVVILKSNKKIDSVNCSCSDFQSMFQYYRNKDELSEYDKIKPIKKIFSPHTKEEPKYKNPKNKGYLCKHLIAFTQFIDKKNEKT